MPKIPQTGGGGISRQEVEQIVHETDNKIKFLPIQGESAYNIVAWQIGPKMLNISNNTRVNVPLTYSDFKYNIQLAQHQDETQKEIYSTFNLDFKNYSLEIFIKILNQLDNLENRVIYLEQNLPNPEERMIMTNLTNPSSEAIIEIRCLNLPLYPDYNYFYIVLMDPQDIEVGTPWGVTMENYFGVGDYQTQYMDFKVYGAELMIGDMYVYEIMNNN